MKNGNYLEWTRSHTYHKQNLQWYANCTQNITNINFTNPAPVAQRQSNNGYEI